MSKYLRRSTTKSGAPNSRARTTGALAAVACMVAGAGIGPAASASARVSGPDDGLVYVGNSAGAPIYAYEAGAAGSAVPARTIPVPQDPQAYWDPWSLTFDRSGFLYAQSFLSDASTYVFRSGGTHPARIFRVNGPDSDGIAVDSKGYEYVIGGEGPPLLSVAAPKAKGVPSNSYSVPTVRSIPVDQDGAQPWPDVLAVEGNNEVIVAVARSGGNALEIFEGGRDGTASPVRTISGPLTGLGSCPDDGNGGCDHMSVTWSAVTGSIYVAVSTASGAHVSEFAGSADGNVAPLATISGPATDLGGRVITGIAVGGSSGDVYVMARTAQFQGAAAIDTFARGATGNSSPLRQLEDPSDLANSAGIALGH